MSQDVLGEFPPSFPTRFRGYDRDAVDHELRELHAALDYAHEERDRAVARALALETAAGDPATAPASTTVQWLIDTAEQDAARIRAEAEDAARRVSERADELLRHRVELVEEAQREADACRAQAAQEARQIVHEALEKASTLLRGLQESEVSLQELFGSGALHHRMPPPRRSTEQRTGQHAKAPQPQPQPQPRPAAQQPANSVVGGQPSGPVPQQVPAAPPAPADVPPS
ncbi:DivIVA domain-containing protein [Actinophytocola sp. KF-1]